MIAIRDPATSLRMAFPPKALLFGASSAVLPSNCFSRLLDVLFDRIFGTPLIGYFGDFGAVAPKNLGRCALRTFERFRHTVGIKLKTAKTDRWQMITPPVHPMRLPATCEQHAADHHAPWREGKALDFYDPSCTFDWAHFARRTGICHCQTLVYANLRLRGVGRCMMAPLYAKLRTDPYHSILSGREASIIGWRAAELPNMEPRVATPKGGGGGDLVQRITHSDAAGESRIIAAVVSDPSMFKTTKYIRSITSTRTGVEGSRHSPRPVTFTASKC